MVKGHNDGDGHSAVYCSCGSVKNKIKKTLYHGAMLCFFMIIGVLFLGQQSFATTSDTVILNKALANGLKRCYSATYMLDGSDENKRITANNTLNASYLLTKNGKKDDIINLPSKVGNNLNVGHNTISCLELFDGYQFGFQNMKGLLDSSVSRENLLNKLGYIKSTSGSAGVCLWYEYYYKSNNGTAKGETNHLCFKVNDNNTVSIGNTTSTGGANGSIYIRDDGGDVRAYSNDGPSDIGTGKFLFNLRGGQTIDEFKNTANSGVSNIAKMEVNGANITPSLGFDDSGNGEKEWKIFSWDSSALIALKNLTSYGSWDEAAFTNQEKYDLYVGYLLGKTSVFGLYPIPSSCTADLDSAPVTSIPLSENGTTLWCNLGGESGESVELDNGKKVNVFPAGGNTYLDSNVGARGVIAALRGMNLDGVTLATIDTSTGSVSDPIAHTTDGSNTCKTSSGALGWIVCPVITWVGKTLNTVYEEMVEPFLKIEPDLVSTNGATFQAWEVFRNIANIVFVILFLFVIFSQVTGIGIDNYGIKKILPKLIVSAILINLSYIICQLAVDLSNIVGSGANIMLSEIADKIPVDGFSGGANSGLWFKHVLNSLLGIIGAGEIAGVALAISSVGVLSALILPLLFGLFTALISVVCFFGLLGLRQACVIALVAIAPLAFVCYMLPNTKRIFDKWLKLLEAMLLLYPICGLIIGGSALASRIMIGNSTNFFVYLIGLVITVVPFFLIPTLLKNSFNLLGNIGAKVMSSGNRFARNTGTRAEKRIKGTDLYKNAEERRAENRVRFRAGLDKDGEARDLNGMQRFLRGGRRNVARARAQYLKNQSARVREESLMGEGFQAGLAGVDEEARKQRSKDQTALAMASYPNEGLEQLEDRWERAFVEGDMEELDALTNIMTTKYGTAAAGSIGDRLSRMEHIADNPNYQRSLRQLQWTMNNNSTFAGNMKNKASDAFQMISNAGLVARRDASGNLMRDADGNLLPSVYRDLDYFSEHNNTSTDVKDWSTQSAATLRRAINAGQLDREMARDLLNSTDPAVMSGIQSDRGKRDVLQAFLQTGRAAELTPEGRPNLDWQRAEAQNYRDSHPSQADQDRQRQEDMARDLSEINRRLRGGPGRGRRGGGPAP